MLYCPHCGTSNREGSRFCNNCGEPLPPSSGQKCSRCGHLNPPGVFSCVRCKASLLAPSIDEGLRPEEPSEEPEWLQGLEEAPWEPEEVLEGVEEEPEWLRELGAPADEVRVVAEEEVPGEEETAPWLEALEGLVEEIPLEPREKEGLLVGITGALRVEPIFAIPHRLGEVASPPLAGADQAARFEGVVGQPLAPVATEERARAPMTKVISWLFYLILAAAVVVGILLAGENINLPLTQATADFYETIESLQEGSVALLSHDYDPGTAAEITPQVSAILDHLMRRGAKIVNLSLTPEGQALADRALESVVSDHDGYIQDYINLGYVAGNEVGARFIAEGLGPRLSPYPLGAAVRGLEDVDLIIVLAGSQELLRRWVEQVQAPYKVAMVAGVSAQVDPAARPYYRSGQLEGLLSGLVGAAEYERLNQHPGVALSRMLPQAAAHLVIALFILLGNFAHLVERLGGRG